jgi:hypothetical protein
MAIHLCFVYGHPEKERWFREVWARTGKKLDLGKACLRFRKLEDLALDVIGEAIRRTPARSFIQHYESMIKQGRSRPARKSSRAAAESKARKKPTKVSPAKRRK